jgi:hypothetical protein
VPHGLSLRRKDDFFPRGDIVVSKGDGILALVHGLRVRSCPYFSMRPFSIAKAVKAAAL